jgi:hypothetical protein
MALVRERTINQQKVLSLLRGNMKQEDLEQNLLWTLLLTKFLLRAIWSGCALRAAKKK